MSIINSKNNNVNFQIILIRKINKKLFRKNKKILKIDMCRVILQLKLCEKILRNNSMIKYQMQNLAIISLQKDLKVLDKIWRT
jgi:hypothetical protein